MAFDKFAEETSIHGIAEWNRAGACGRVFWGVLFLGSLAFFGVAISSLVFSFIQKHPVSSVSNVPMEIPPFGLKMKGQHRSEFENVEDITINGASPDEIALVKAIIKGHRFVENQSFNVSGKRLTELLDAVYTKPELALTLTSSFDSETMKKYVRMTNVYNFETGGLANRLSQVIEFNSSVFLQPDSSIWIQPSSQMCEKGKKYGFWAGSEAFHGDTLRSAMGQMSCGAKYIIQVGVTRYMRDKHYCNPDLGRYGNKLSCAMTCLGRKQAERRCGVYVHSMIDDAVVTPCDPAGWAAEKGESPFNSWVKIWVDCKKECKECVICRTPCDEIRVGASVRDGQGDIQGSHSIEIYFANSEAMTLIETTVKVGPVDLLSNIGGTLGLCVGASLMSVVHVLCFLFETIRCKLGKQAEPEDLENA